ncbi:MAG: mannose-6-phosphate isomerase [Chloroflexi bacterium]|nr:MAG: mannose-6-phosphate isomerase [Chloroflexota bacterium]
MGPAAVGERRLFAPDVSISDGRGVCGPLAQVARQLGPCLLGEGAHGRGPGCVPITIKLLDVGEWLSLQVHPESVAARAECAASLEMTEAWVILDADAGSRVIHGLQRELDQAVLRAPDLAHSLGAYARFVAPQRGDVFFVPPGMVHALGPSLLVYEVAQHADVTYRLYDWGRSESLSRPLAIECGLVATDLSAVGGHTSPAPATTGSASMNELLLRSDAYDVRRVRIGDDELRLETGGGCQVITTVSGEVTVRTSCAQRTLGRHASALIPAATSEYRLGGAPGAVALLTIPR